MVARGQFTMRDGRSGDIPAVLKLIRQLEKGSGREVTVSEATLANGLLDPSGAAHLLVVEENEEILGYAIWNHSYSSRLGKHRIYMADLCVSENSRRRGVGKALVCHLKSMCEKNGYERLEWKTQRDNVSARDFYKSLGATERPDIVCLYV